jgi:hypothetical protein
MVSINEPRDLNDRGTTSLLDGIQGNILKAHAIDHAPHLLVRFGTTRQARMRNRANLQAANPPPATWEQAFQFAQP